MFFFSCICLMASATWGGRRESAPGTIWPLWGASLKDPALLFPGIRTPPATPRDPSLHGSTQALPAEASHSPSQRATRSRYGV